MSLIWKKENAQIHQGQIPLEGDSYKHLTFHHGLERKIPFGGSKLAPIYEEMGDNKTSRIRLDFTDLFDDRLGLDDRRYLRIGHQRRSHKKDHKFVVYLPKWFQEKYCVRGKKDYFLPKIELRETNIYLYVIPNISKTREVT